ncbi:MAG: SDR family oxidoreductase [Pseudonocardiaceae bacterium]
MDLGRSVLAAALGGWVVSGPSRTALVFGGSRGIGAAIAQRLMPTYNVFVASRSSSAPEGIHSTHVVTCDVRDGEQVDSIFKQLAQHQVAVDIVINSAGVGSAFDPLDPSSQRWSEMLDTNVTGVANQLSSVLRLAPAVSTFVHVSSVAGKRLSPFPEYLLYSVSKIAAEQLLSGMRSRQDVLERGLRIVGVSPGFVRNSGFAEHFYGASGVPPGKYDDPLALEPRDVAEVVAELVDTGSLWITDVTLAHRKGSA